jgi:hypothetical protein
MVCFCDGTCSSFCHQSSGPSLCIFHWFAVKCHSSLQNQLHGPQGWILCEQSSWSHRNWWTCSWLCSRCVWTFLFGGLLHCLSVINITPALVTSDNTKLHCWKWSVEALAAIWYAASSDQLSESCANIWQRIDACPISQNWLPCPTINSDIISRVLNGLMLIVSGYLELMVLPLFWSSTKDIWLALNWVCHSSTCVQVMLSSLNARLISAMVSVSLFQRSAQNLMHTHCSFVVFFLKLHQARYTTPNKRM